MISVNPNFSDQTDHERPAPDISSSEVLANDILSPETESEEERQNPIAHTGQSLPPQPQLHAHLLRIASNTEQLQLRIEQIVDEVQHSGAQIDVLTQHLAAPPGALEEHLANLAVRQETTQDQLQELTRAVSKLSRTQFKSNALSESKEKQVGAALTTLQNLASRREEIQTQRSWRDQQYLANLRAHARGELAVELLPALDGLEAALESGKALLQRRHQQATERNHLSVQSPSFRERLGFLFSSEAMPVQEQGIPEEATDMDEALKAWMQGLELVQERFLGLLAGEGIQPISTQDQMFDPHQHVAVDTVVRQDAPPGTIVDVVRKGYRQGDRILRFAEVVVAKEINN